MGLNAHFFYPTHGISQVAERLAGCLRRGVRYGCGVNTVDPQAHMAYLEDGTTVSYRRMVSTMPLPIFLVDLRHLINRAACSRSRSSHWICS